MLDIDDLSDDERAAIPPWWVEAAEKPGRSAVIHAFAQWDGVLPGLLPRFKRRLADAGIGIYVGRGVSKPVLAYVLMGESGLVCCYGYPPCPQLRHPSLYLSCLPSTLQTLYTGLHDGFKRATAFENGLPTHSELLPVSHYGSAGRVRSRW